MHDRPVPVAVPLKRSRYARPGALVGAAPQADAGHQACAGAAGEDGGVRDALVAFALPEALPLTPVDKDAADHGDHLFGVQWKQRGVGGRGVAGQRGRGRKLCAGLQTVRHAVCPAQ